MKFNLFSLGYWGSKVLGHSHGGIQVMVCAQLLHAEYATLQLDAGGN